MNPPFHDGKTTDPTIGLRFIGSAATGLKPGGHLWLVANRQLPYERALTELFTESRLVDERNGFKVLHAVGPKVAAQSFKRGRSR
jgi:16S rRNA (guanine1207-N2)-methyltransferase